VAAAAAAAAAAEGTCHMQRATAAAPALAVATDSIQGSSCHRMQKQRMGDCVSQWQQLLQGLLADSQQQINLRQQTKQKLQKLPQLLLLLLLLLLSSLAQ
jgi:hypothetical protein